MASIMGEAPETESEEEIDTEHPQKEKVKTAFIIKTLNF
jgi:hypothetical protein